LKKEIEVRTFKEAEAATEAARRCYEALVIKASQEAGGKASLSKLLGYDSPGTVHNAIIGGKFSAIRRIAAAAHKKGLIQ